MSKLAVQMYTVREHTRTLMDLAQSLEKIRRIGYRAVQMSAVGAMDGETPEVSAKAARKMLDDNGLRCIATHRSWDKLSTQTDVEIDFHRILGCDFTAIGSLPQSYTSDSAAGYRRFLKDAEPLVRRLKEAGIRFGVHNHDHEFQRVGPGRKTLFDILIDEGGAELMLEVDVYWVNHAGADPAGVLTRCTGRAPVIHVKDKEVIPSLGPVMAPIGEGNLDWDRILPAGCDAGVEWYAVEQDEYRRDPFDCLNASYRYLSDREAAL